MLYFYAHDVLHPTSNPTQPAIVPTISVASLPANAAPAHDVIARVSASLAALPALVPFPALDDQGRSWEDTPELRAHLALIGVRKRTPHEPYTTIAAQLAPEHVRFLDERGPNRSAALRALIDEAIASVTGA